MGSRLIEEELDVLTRRLHSLAPARARTSPRTRVSARVVSAPHPSPLQGEWTVPSGEYEAFVAPCAGCLGAAAPVTFSIGTRASVVTRAEGEKASGGAPCRAGAVAAAQNAAAVAVM